MFCNCLAFVCSFVWLLCAVLCVAPIEVKMIAELQGVVDFETIKTDHVPVQITAFKLMKENYIQ